MSSDADSQAERVPMSEPADRPEQTPRTPDRASEVPRPPEGGAVGPGERRAETAAKKSSVMGTLLEIVVIITAAFVIALIVQAFLVKPFTIHQVSMRPTLEEGDRILLNRLAYRFGEPARGDVIVFHSPINADEDLVKRIVGVAGDRISISGGKLYVNGVPQDEPYLLEQNFSGEMQEMTVPTGRVFVLGDNRNNSGDSRLFGPIATNTVIGKAFVVYWPISHWKRL
jgi:signal peptidase I